jgi:hypothetical protein
LSGAFLALVGSRLLSSRSSFLVAFLRVQFFASRSGCLLLGFCLRLAGFLALDAGTPPPCCFALLAGCNLQPATYTKQFFASRSSSFLGVVAAAALVLVVAGWQLTVDG